MKKLFLVSGIALAFFASCGNSKQEAATEVAAVDSSLQVFGEAITQDGAISADQLIGQMHGKDSLKIKLTGAIAEVCQKKGCWMNVNLGNDKTMRVSFKDYAFFVPKDAAGKTMYIEGVAFTDTTSVADLKHFAEDAGKSKEEMEKITEPEINISFEANGVIIKK